MQKSIASKNAFVENSGQAVLLLFIFIFVIGIACWFVYSEFADDGENHEREGLTKLHS